jgi:hypothetical protein
MYALRHVVAKWIQETITCVGLLASVLLHADSPGLAADFTITPRLVATNTPPIGVNEFGDPGGTSYSAGNLIPDPGFEPISIRRFWRATAAGPNWVDLDAGGVTDWDLVQGGYLSGATFRIYRIVDAAGAALPIQNNYLDLARADRFTKVREGRVIAAGAPGYPQGGWVATRYAQPAKVFGTRTSLSFTDAQWVDNGTAYYYIVTAVSDGSSTDLNSLVESDRTTAVEVTATPDASLAGGPRIYVADGDSFSELPRATAGGWMSFRPRLANAAGTVTWSLLNAQNQPVAPPAGLGFSTATGELSGAPTATPATTVLRFRATCSNGSDTRDFTLNPALWTPSGNTAPPQPPQQVRAEAGRGFVRLTWQASPSANVVGYRVYRSIAPRAAQVQRVYFEGDGPAPAPLDYLMFELRTNRLSSAWSHPRVRDINGVVSETWRNSGSGTVQVSREFHQPNVPASFRFPGETCLKVQSSSSGPQSVAGPAILFPSRNDGEALWYGQLEPGKSYRYEIWLRQEGLGNNGRVELGFNQIYTGIRQAFSVTQAWQKFGFEFTAPAVPTEGYHGMPRLSFTGPGTLWMDNVRLFRFDTPGEKEMDFVPSRLMFDELMASQPAAGPKGMLRSMGILLNASTMRGNLGFYRDASATFDWYQAVGGAGAMTLPFFLETALRTGDRPETRMKPWLNIPSFTTEAEWLALIEYLGATINPEDPADVAAKPYAHLRYQQRGTVTPWADEFPRILLEFANETWHNRAVSQFWWGWGPAFGVHQGGREFGFWARYITDHVAAQSPSWAARNLGEKLHFVMGSNYRDYAETGRPLAPQVRAIGHTTYVGPTWETGEAPNAAFNDHGVQGTLLGYVAGTAGELDLYRRQREALAALGQDYELLGYEGGPSGYSLPGTASAEQVEISEQYGKSLAMGVAALDAWLGSYEHGFTENGQLAFAQGTYWSSHTLIKDGFRPHAGWLALTLRNRYATGQMVRVSASSMPTLAWDGRDRPLAGCYAFREGSKLSVVVLSRKLGGIHDGRDFGDGSIPVTLRLPAKPVGTATLIKLTGDPRASNRQARVLDLQTEFVTLGQVHTFTLPQGSIFLFVTDTELPNTGAAPGTPLRLRASLAPGGTTLTWDASEGATGYRVYRSSRAAFSMAEASLEIPTAGTSFLDDEAVGGTAYFFRVAATNLFGESPPSLVAVGGTNTSAPVLPAPAIQGVGEGNQALRVSWTSVSGAISYRVGWSTQSGGPYVWTSAGTATAYTVSGLENDRPHFVTVQALAVGGRSPNSREVQGTPRGGAAEQALAAWDLDGRTSYESAAPVSHYALGLTPSSLTRGAGLVAGESGYHPLGGSFGFQPQTDSANFGAPGGGSLANATARNLYVSITLTPQAGTSLSVKRLLAGALYPYSNRPLLVQLQYKIGSGALTPAHPNGIAITTETQTPTDLSIDTSGIGPLQGATQSVELRLYLFSTAADARWCRAGIRRTAGEDLVVVGTVKQPEPPRASIGWSDAMAVITWPDTPGFRMQSSTNLGSQALWIDWTGPVTSTDGTARVLLAPAEPMRFFRWIQP